MPEDTINAGNYTPITRALREYIERHPTMMHAVGLTDQCDNIDALHKSLERKNAGMRDFCERVEQAAQAREDVTLWGVDYMPLPLDADDVPIHVGDVMKGEKVGGGFGEPFEVVGYIMSNGELEPMDEHKLPRKRKYSHHHHAPTVEDVLREMLDVWGELPSNVTNEAIIAEYAAKLRLADDGEEQ